MKTIEIWMEGYRATGESSDASLLAKYEANNFFEAVEMYAKQHPNTVEWNGRRFTIWACGLYDNETDARKSFG